jgi:hypothetical protein
MQIKTKIITIALAILTTLVIVSSFFILQDLQKKNIGKTRLLPTSNDTSITEMKKSVNLKAKNLSTSISQISQTKVINKYEYAGQSISAITLAPGEKQSLTLDLKNTGNAAWEKTTFHLGTSHSQDRTSIFADSSWLSQNRIGINQDTIDVGYTAHFNFTITAPQTSGIYYEYVRPVIDGSEWLSDVGIYWKITVKNVGEDESVLPVYNKIGVKKIVITISTQNLKCFEGTDIVCDFTISSGLPGLDTPTGNFKIQRKRDVAYSAAYDLYMNYWMAFTPNEAYGIHELPYWKYSWGIVTEGANHLGQRVSHGCVRLGIGSAKQVYDWAPIGTPVEIVN